jgi:hypothetical protein
MRALAAVAVLASLLLAGCAGAGGKKAKCPAAFTAPGLESYTQLRPGATGGGLENIAFGVKVFPPRAECKSEPGGIRVTTFIVFQAVRNDPDLRQGDFSYFVAVADPQQNILAKQSFGLRADFAAGQKQMRIQDEITSHLPLKDLSTSGNYAVIVGMQLSSQQLEQRQRGQP